MNTATDKSRSAAKPRVSNRAEQTGQTTSSLRLDEQPARELNFADDAPERRVGDSRPASELRREFPPQRVREAGHSGGELAEPGVTADDLSPETLLDEEPSRTPGAAHGREPLDTALQTIDDSVVGDGGAGLGHGADEAELAEREPLGRAKSDALRRKARQHARDANAAEPHEAEELAAAARARAARSER